MNITNSTVTIFYQQPGQPQTVAAPAEDKKAEQIVAPLLVELALDLAPHSTRVAKLLKTDEGTASLNYETLAQFLRERVEFFLTASKRDTSTRLIREYGLDVVVGVLSLLVKTGADDKLY